MLRQWELTVVRVMPSACAIASLSRPCALSQITSISREEVLSAVKWSTMAGGTSGRLSVSMTIGGGKSGAGSPRAIALRVAVRRSLTDWLGLLGHERRRNRGAQLLSPAETEGQRGAQVLQHMLSRRGKWYNSSHPILSRLCRYERTDPARSAGAVRRKPSCSWCRVVSRPVAWSVIRGESSWYFRPSSSFLAAVRASSNGHAWWSA